MSWLNHQKSPLISVSFRYEAADASHTTCSFLITAICNILHINTTTGDNRPKTSPNIMFRSINGSPRDLFIVTLSGRGGRRLQTPRIRHVHSRTPQSATFYVSTQRPETTGGCRRPWPQLCFLEVRATLLPELPNFVQQLPSGP